MVTAHSRFSEALSSKETQGSSPWEMAIAALAQLVEQLICNQPVVGSSPTCGSMLGAYRKDQFRLLTTKSIPEKG